MQDSYSIELVDASADFPAGKKILSSAKVIKLGRSNECNIRFSEKWINVSRLHALLSLEPDGVYLIPQHGADNITYVGQRAIVGKKKLKHRQIIQLSQNGPQLRLLLRSESNRKSGFHIDKVIIYLLIIICVLVVFTIILISI